MKRVARWLLLLAAGALGCAAEVRAADSAAAPGPALAHSALVNLEAVSAQGGIVLRLRRAADQTPLAVSDLAVAIDGKSQPATRRADGSWFVPLPGAHAPARLEVIAAHDGIRELLSAQLAASAPATPAAGASGALREHKQMAWWVLNIAIVLIAVLALSRRMS